MTSAEDPLFVRQLEAQLFACKTTGERTVLLMAWVTAGATTLANEKGRAYTQVLLNNLAEYIADTSQNPDWPT